MDRRRICAATAFAAAFLVVGVCLPASPSRADDEEAHTLLFSGRDHWRNGAFAHGGLLMAAC